MNEWFKKTVTQIKTLWSKWTPIQKRDIGSRSCCGNCRYRPAYFMVG